MSGHEHDHEHMHDNHGPGLHEAGRFDAEAGPGIHDHTMDDHASHFPETDHGHEHTIELKQAHACGPDCPEHAHGHYQDHHNNQDHPLDNTHDSDHNINNHGHEYEAYDHTISLKPQEHACAADCLEHGHGNHDDDHVHGHVHNHENDQGPSHHIEQKPHACGADCPGHNHQAVHAHEHQQTDHAREHHHSHSVNHEHRIESKPHACSADCPEHSHAGTDAEAHAAPDKQEPAISVHDRTIMEIQAVPISPESGSAAHVHEQRMEDKIPDFKIIQETIKATDMAVDPIRPKQEPEKNTIGIADDIVIRRQTDTIPLIAIETPNPVIEADADVFEADATVDYCEPLVSAGSADNIEMTEATSIIESVEEIPISLETEAIDEADEYADMFQVIDDSPATILPVSETTMDPETEAEVDNRPLIIPEVFGNDTSELLTAGNTAWSLENNHADQALAAVVVTAESATRLQTEAQAPIIRILDSEKVIAQDAEALISEITDMYETFIDSVGTSIDHDASKHVRLMSNIDTLVSRPNISGEMDREVYYAVVEVLRLLGYEQPTQTLKDYTDRYGVGFMYEILDRLRERLHGGGRFERLTVKAQATVSDGYGQGTLLGRFVLLILGKNVPYTI